MSANGAKCESLRQRPWEVLVKSYSSAEGATLETVPSLFRSFGALSFLIRYLGRYPRLSHSAPLALLTIGAEIDLPIRCGAKENDATN